ncbi:MAG TPA: antibiotic biosynthesis monooxygenase [Gammaproteobacteria bacterium]
MSDGFPATLPEPPYWAVIFTSAQADDLDGYSATAARMLELARRQPGFLGVESVREGGRGVTVSYWRDLESIRAWRDHPEHREARRHGREQWYRRWALRVARVERDGPPPEAAEPVP